jgi:Domain of unknown function (DUF397)
MDREVRNWRKARRSGGNGGACVEVGNHGDGVAVRDTKRRDGAELRFSAKAWEKFVAETRDDR